MPNRQVFLSTVRSLEGTPYRHQGRSKAGVDCLGLAALAYYMNGWEVKDDKGYSATPDPYYLEQRLLDNLDYGGNRLDRAENGDILLFRIRTQAQHVAIKDGDYMIHAYRNVGKVVRDRITDNWRVRFMKFFKHRTDSEL